MCSCTSPAVGSRQRTVRRTRRPANGRRRDPARPGGRTERVSGGMLGGLLPWLVCQHTVRRLPWGPLSSVVRGRGPREKGSGHERVRDDRPGAGRVVDDHDAGPPINRSGRPDTNGQSDGGIRAWNPCRTSSSPFRQRPWFAGSRGPTAQLTAWELADYRWAGKRLGRLAVAMLTEQRRAGKYAVAALQVVRTRSLGPHRRFAGCNQERGGQAGRCWIGGPRMSGCPRGSRCR